MTQSICNRSVRKSKTRDFWKSINSKGIHKESIVYLVAWVKHILILHFLLYFADSNLKQ